MSNNILGGYCGGVPPLPIPNREVKPACADGTAMQCGRVGGCLLYLRSSRSNDFGDPFLCPYFCHVCLSLYVRIMLLCTHNVILRTYLIDNHNNTFASFYNFALKFIFKPKYK